MVQWFFEHFCVGVMTNHVETDNPTVDAILQKIIVTAVNAGVELHPSLLIVEKDGEMSLHSKMYIADAQDEKIATTLCRIPRDLLLPVKELKWEDHSDKLILKAMPDSLSLVQQELLALQIELYNATGKLKNMTNHPFQLLKDHSQLLQSVNQLKPWVNDVLFKPLADAFIGQRYCWINPIENTSAISMWPDFVSGERAIVPILDLLNNHHKGCDFEFDNYDLKLPSTSLVGNTTECFLKYNTRTDVLDWALGMGYFDVTTPYAHSAPFSTTEEFGILQIEGVKAASKNSFAMPRVQFTDHGIKISHFTCHLNKPKRSLLPFTLAIEGLSRRSGGTPSDARRLVSTATKALLHENLIRLENICTIAESLVPNWPSAQVFVDASRRQASIFCDVLSPALDE